MMFLIFIFFGKPRAESTCLRFELMPFGRVTYNVASAACSSRNGRLTYFLNAAEEEQFAAWSNEVGLVAKTWLDLKRNGDTFVIPSLGYRQYPYASWGTDNQPDNAGGIEDCVELRSLFDWNDIPCDAQLHFTCRYDEEMTGCNENNLQCPNESLEGTRNCLQFEHVGSGSYYNAQNFCREINAAPTYFLTEEELDKFSAWKNQIGLTYFTWLDIYQDNQNNPTVIDSLGIKQPQFFFDYDQPNDYDGDDCVIFRSSSNWGYFPCSLSGPSITYKPIPVTCRKDIQISENEYCRPNNNICPSTSTLDNGYSCVCLEGFVLNKDKTGCVSTDIQCPNGFVAIHGGTECKNCNHG